MDNETKPNILCIDIETLPIFVAVWEVNKQQYVGMNQMIKDWSIGSFSAKWVGDPDNKIIQDDTRNQKDIHDDKRLVKHIVKLLDKADYVLSQNGKAFDWPKIKARIMLNGLNEPSYFKHIDVYLRFREVGFTSHSLDYLTHKFCKKYKKLPHKNFPGMDLWLACEARNPKAWKEMEVYNIGDVFSTEELYFSTKKYDPRTEWELNNPVPFCKKCGSKQFRSNGIRANYRRLFCRLCGTPNNVKIVEVKK